MANVSRCGAFARPTFRASASARVPRPAVACDSPNQPERADPDRRRTVNEHRAVGRVISDLQELVDLLELRIGVHDRNVEVLETGLFNGLALFVGTMLPGGAQVHDGLHAIGLETGEVLGPRLPARAEVGRDTQEVPDGRRIGRRGGLRHRSGGASLQPDGEERDGDHVAIVAQRLGNPHTTSPRTCRSSTPGPIGVPSGTIARAARTSRESTIRA